MASKLKKFYCPICKQEFIHVKGQCDGVVVPCPKCGASIFVEVNKITGQVKLNMVDGSAQEFNEFEEGY